MPRTAAANAASRIENGAGRWIMKSSGLFI
jgi:hypothetical protein